MSENAQRSSLLGIAAFLVLAFGLAWGPWFLLLPANAANDMTKYELPLLPGAFAPALATFIVRRWITREGFADAGLGLHLRNWRYYLIGWFFPLVVVGFVILIAPRLGLGTPDFTLRSFFAQHGAHLPAIPHATLLVPLSTLLTALIATPILFGEEFGWRGYLQLRLFPGRPTLAAIATGIIWGLWHWPIIAHGFEFPGDPVIAAVVFCTGTTFIAIIFGWLRRRSGSVWCTSLAHAATNGIGGSLIAMWIPDRTHWLLASYLGLLGWVPLGLFALWIVVYGGRVSARA